MQITARWLAKAGNSPDDYEDACRHSCDAASRFAVADGATEASFSGAWANMLVRAYCDGVTTKRSLAVALPELQQRLQSVIGAKPLPWYAEAKARSGAFATLLGLTIRGFNAGDDDRNPALSGRWTALGIGDSCLVQVRDDRLMRCFPIDESAAFTNRPVLLSSEPSSNERLEIARTSGRWRLGDRFYLMTDALAHWFLLSHEQGELPWTTLDAVMDHEGMFGDWVGEVRAARRMRNDDVTLLRVAVR